MISIKDLEFLGEVLLWYRYHMTDQIQVCVDYLDNDEWRNKNIDYCEKEIGKTLDVYGHLLDYIDSLRK